jgi:hypothetical protein
LAVYLANSASQFSPIFGKTARKVVDLMVQLGFVSKIRGYPYRGPTTIQATQKLREHLPLGTITWDALRLEEAHDLVILKKRDKDELTTTDSALRSATTGATLQDALWLKTVRDQMATINAAILSTPIECHGSAVAHISEQPGAATASIATLHHRTLRRIFNGSWEEGGRLFSAFYQTMPKADRFKFIRIGGEPVAVVDYQQLFLRLAYARVGTPAPVGDLYDVTGSDCDRLDWDLLRSARKRLVNALFFRRAPLKQWPGSTLAEIAELRDAFGAGIKPIDAIQAIKTKHEAIAALFERGLGLGFMRQESDIISAVTLRLFNTSIPALPIHDAVLVTRQHSTVASSVMQEEALRITGADVPVDVQFK